MSEHSKFDENGLSEDEKLLSEYWSGLRECMQKNGRALEEAKPPPRHSAKSNVRHFSLGLTGFQLMAAVRCEDDIENATILVRLMFCNPMQQAAAHLRLHQQKAEIENDIGTQLEWEPPKISGPKQMIRLCRKNCNVRNKNIWSELHQWHQKYLEKFHDAFHERIKNLSGQ